jgi:hypothetical protein
LQVKTLQGIIKQTNGFQPASSENAAVGILVDFGQEPAVDIKFSTLTLMK